MSEHELKLLARQGFVAGQRQGGRVYFRLHWRHEGRQHVRYIGSAELAAAVRKELDVLQRDVRTERLLTARTRAATKAIREAKRRLAPVLAAHGYTFHGLAIRRPRRRRSENSKLVSPFFKMERSMTPENVTSEPTDELVDEIGENDVEEFDEAAAIRAERMARVSDWEEEALARPDAMAAVLATTCATLARHNFWVGDAIDREMASGPADVDRLRRVQPAIDDELRLTRQIERFAQLEVRDREARRSTADRGAVDPRRVSQFD